MSQVDNRNSSAAKRARTDGSRREDDWTCPSCGNVNFSFRTTCNMRNCTQSRPADHNSKPAVKPLQAPPVYTSSAAYMGSAPSMYLGAPPYGSSLFNGASLQPYDLPFSGGSGYHYDYGSRLSVGSPYGPLHLSGPSPYSSGSMLGSGGMYGMPPLMDRYGLGLPMGHAAMGARPGAFPNENHQKKGADTGRDSDWTCPNCGNVNFSFRTVCNMRKCNTPKPGTQASKSENSKGSKTKMPEGSWKCGANYTPAAAAAAPPTNCCWFVFAAYIFAAIRHSNATGEAFLPAPTASSCSDAFAAYLLRHGLVRPKFLLSAGRCTLNGDDPSQLAAGKRACQYYTVADIRSNVNLSSAIKVCTSGHRDMTYDQASCNACKSSVIAATLSLLQITKSKEFVPCGMATTIGIWASLPEIERFRSYALCMVQVLDDVGSLGTSSLIPSPPPPPPPPRPREENPKKPRAAIKIAASSAAAGLLFVAAVLVLFFAIRKRRRSTLVSFSVGNPMATIESPLPTDGLYIFTKSELKQATNDFDPELLLGEGGAGKVYLGKLPSGQHVAIKRIQLEKKLGEFYREIEILAKLRHRNLTTLVGYCLHKKEHVLVYEYMPGGNLSHALYHGELTWHRRVQIAVDIAEGLAYLHEFPEGAVIHRDVKPTNVLLNDLGLAKLSDFGVSKILPSEISHVSTMEIKGTRGYVDPECFSMGHVSEATDVYSFGIVLLELITGRKAVIPTPSGGAESIVYSAHELMGRGAEPDVGKIMDRRLEPGLDTGSVREVFKVAYRCVKPYKNERPKMKEVLGVLKRVLAELEGVGPTEVEAAGSTGDEVVSRDLSLASTLEVTTPSVDAWSL